MKRLAAAAALALSIFPANALAWGNSGHRAVGEAAMRALPQEIPGFLRTPQAALDVGELSREPDRLKGGSKVYDADMSPAHYVDVDTDGKILGAMTLQGVPANRPDYERALNAAGQDGWKAGYLPYAIIETYDRLTKDFAYWRVLKAAEANPKWKAHHAWFAADRRRREALILNSIGFLSHYVGDGSQPLHVSVHANGWGEGPNPQGYTNERIHGPFESDMVSRTLRPSEITRQMTPVKLCGCSMDQRVKGYLVETATRVEPLYKIITAGGIAEGDPRGPAFAHTQMARGASELRDVIVESWRASAKQTVGWKPIAVGDVVAGRTDPYPALYGTID